MKQITELLETGQLEELDASKFIPEGSMTVKELIAKMGLTEFGVHAIIVNGKRAEGEDLITPQSTVTIIPALAGG